MKPRHSGEVFVATPAMLVRRYREMIFDHGAKARAAVEREQGPVSCRAGCSWCCHSKILIDQGQAIILYLYLKRSGLWTSALERRLAQADEAMTHESHDAWFNRHEPCVFLVASDDPMHALCSVYPVRPLACASTFSVRDPIECATLEGETAHWLDDARPFTEFFVGLILGAGETEVLAMTLPGAVLYAHAVLEGLPRPPVHSLPMEVLQERGHDYFGREDQG